MVETDVNYALIYCMTQVRLTPQCSALPTISTFIATKTDRAIHNRSSMWTHRSLPLSTY